MRKFKGIIGILLTFIATFAFGYERYFLCASDEDGCDEYTYSYCACIPYNTIYAQTPHCLNFDNLTCTAQAETANCDPAFIYKTQGECLAVMYQSVSNPPCALVTHDFCIEHQSKICNLNGMPSTCTFSTTSLQLPLVNKKIEH